MKQIFTVMLLGLTSIQAFAQVAISTNGADPDASAMLDVISTKSGMLIPRMTTVQRDAIASPATGLLIFNHESNAFEYYNGTDWAGISSTAAPDFNQLEFFEIATAVSNSGSGLSIGSFPDAAQTFTPTEDGLLHEVYISLLSSESIQGTLEIYDEAFTTSSVPVYTQSYAVAGTSRLEKITLDQPVGLISNQLHTLRLAPSGGNLRTHFSQNTYPGGEFLNGFNQDLEFALGLSRYPLRVNSEGITFPDGSVLGSSALVMTNDLLRFSDQSVGTAIDLSAYKQTLNLITNQLTISGSGSSVDLSEYKHQTLNFSNDTLSISGSDSSVDLAGYRQTLGFESGTLTLSGGGSSVDMSEAFKNVENFNVYNTSMMVSNSGSGLTLYTASEAAQTFTPLENAYLREVYLSLADTHSLEGTLEVYDEAYTTSSVPIYTQSYVVDGSRLDLVAIDQAVPLISNQVHTLRLVPTGGDLRTHLSNNTYPGGQFVHPTFINDLEFMLAVSPSELQITSTGITFNDGTSLESAAVIAAPQTLTLSSNTLSISEGNSVDLSGYRQTISRSGQFVNLSDGGGSISLITDEIASSNTYVYVTDNQVSFFLEGSEAWRMKSGWLEPVGNGGNIRIGKDTSPNSGSNLNYSVYIGTSSGNANVDGTYNVAVGDNALRSATSALGSTAIGSESLRNNTGLYNTAIGRQAGQNAEGSGNVFIGYAAGRNALGGNKLYIDNSSTDSPLIYGEFDNNLVRINGSLEINNAYRFPATDGGSNQVLITDGSGNASWSNVDVSDADDDPTNELDSKWTAGSGLIYHNGGDVGIGTASPDSILHVKSTSSTGGTADGITLSQGSYNSEVYHNSEGDLVLRKRINTDQLVLDEDGAVGIGTNAPTQTLDINGTIGIRGGTPAAGKVLTATNADGAAVWRDKFSYSHEAGDALVNGATNTWQSVLPSPSQTLTVEADTPVLVYCSFRFYNTGSEAFINFRLQATGPTTVVSTEIGADMPSQKNECHSFHRLITLSQAGSYTFNLQVDTDNTVTVEDLEITTLKLR